jgi:VCBS repeat-containing protein
LVNGEITYDIGDHFQELAEGQVLNDSFAYTISDSKGATATSQVNVNIVGTNDAPIVAADTAHVIEDVEPAAAGNVLDNDWDVDAGTVLGVSDPGGYEGIYGTLSLSADGSYAYTLNNDSSAVQSLGRDTEVVDRFNYNVSDGLADVSSTLEITVKGTNDAPEVVVPLEDRFMPINRPFSWKIPEGHFIDADEGDTLDYTASQADGTELPSWLVFDPASLTFSGTSPKGKSFVDIQITATDKVAVTGSTEGSLSVSDVFRVSFSHGNQGPGNGQDAQPPGHSCNWNDGPGNFPGNPGAKKRMKPHENPGKRLGHAPNDGEAVRKHAEKSCYLDLDQLNVHTRQFEDEAASSQSGNEIYAHWQRMNRALANDASKFDNGAWQHDTKGADIANLGKAAQGFLGSTRAFGTDGFALAGGAGTNLQDFKGLKEGMKQLS